MSIMNILLSLDVLYVPLSAILVVLLIIQYLREERSRVYDITHWVDMEENSWVSPPDTTMSDSDFYKHMCLYYSVEIPLKYVLWKRTELASFLLHVPQETVLPDMCYQDVVDKLNHEYLDYEDINDYYDYISLLNNTDVSLLITIPFGEIIYQSYLHESAKRIRDLNFLIYDWAGEEYNTLKNRIESQEDADCKFKDMLISDLVIAMQNEVESYIKSKSSKEE